MPSAPELFAARTGLPSLPSSATRYWLVLSEFRTRDTAPVPLAGTITGSFASNANTAVARGELTRLVGAQLVMAITPRKISHELHTAVCKK